MKQKLAIACGLLHSPKVIYFDEPLTGLDPLGIRRMKDSILKRAHDGAAIIISSHLLHLVQEICSRLLILKNGLKVVDGTLEEVTRKFSEQPGDASLEEIFFRATSDTGTPRRRCHRRAAALMPTMIAALIYLQYHSVRNRLVSRFKRLKQPKYLIGAIVGGLYFYFYFFRYLFPMVRRAAGGESGISPEHSAF
jgi:ABC-type multidrug transport system ATPase subunit